MSRLISFEEAKRSFAYRFTAEHVPEWAKKPMEGTSLYYAPQYASDREWYDSYAFPGEKLHKESIAGRNEAACIKPATWPAGEILHASFSAKHLVPVSSFEFRHKKFSTPLTFVLDRKLTAQEIADVDEKGLSDTFLNLVLPKFIVKSKGGEFNFIENDGGMSFKIKDDFTYLGDKMPEMTVEQFFKMALASEPKPAEPEQKKSSPSPEM